MKFFLKLGNMKRYNQKRFRAACGVITAALLLTLPIWNNESILYKISNGQETVKADTKSDLQDAKNDLNAAINELKSLQNKSDKTAKDIEDASKVLKRLVAAQQILETQIAEVQADIDQNNIDLAAAQERVDSEYEDMKLRIQFMYENNTTDTLWEAVLTASSFSEVLNRVEYINEVYETDRQMLEDYRAALQEVEDIGAELTANMESLMDLQESYAQQQAAVEGSIAILEEKKDLYADQIADAKQTKNQYQQTVNELQEKVRREEAAAAGANASNYEGGGTGASGGFGSSAYLTDGSCDPAQVTNIDGNELVAYAMQYVGCHYVWAGNEFCNDWSDNVGIDCSGFVKKIYAHFGISTPRYSQSFKTVGQPVSFSNIKAGDVVVYPGHVAIYIGNGCIVEAQGSKKGVTSYRSVNCHQITAIRRLI